MVCIKDERIEFCCGQVPGLQTADLPRSGESAPPSGESFHSAKQREQQEQSQSGNAQLAAEI